MCGLCCGIYGMIIFRGRCCHISITGQVLSEIGNGYTDPCRCRITFDWLDNIGKDVYRFKEGTLPTDHQVYWATPHDFYVNIIARVKITGKVHHIFLGLIRFLIYFWLVSRQLRLETQLYIFLAFVIIEG